MISTKLFGKTPAGEDVTAYTIPSGDSYVTILDLGGIVNTLMLPDKDGNFADVVCGFDTVEGYLTGGGYQGALIGRYANRINGGKFTLDGKEYVLAKNENDINHLHGGNVGFNLKLWDTEIIDDHTIVMTCVSEDGEEGYPGKLDVKVTYTFKNCVLRIRYEAVSTKDTICNLTNHTYFNLAGYDSGSICKHVIRIPGDMYTEIDENFITLGSKPVNGIFDLRKPTEMINNIDHNFFLGKAGIMKLAAEVSEPIGGRCMTVCTDQPCIQLYTAVMMNGDVPFKGGVKQVPHTAFCLETQFPPDSPNHPEYPQPVLLAGEKYDYTTVFAFRVK